MMSNQTKFNQFIESIEGLNPKTLSARLKEMEKNGLVYRKIYHEIVLHSSRILYVRSIQVLHLEIYGQVS
jgi:DNA-binding HxlR family transcriptional regulator